MCDVNGWIHGVVQIKFNQLVYENVYTIIYLPKKRTSVTADWNISKSFTHKMAAKTSWHR